MTATLLALVAGMAVGSDGTERISPEAQVQFLGSGYWEGIGQLAGSDRNEGQTVTVKFQPGIVQVEEIKLSIQWVDAGRGKCRMIASRQIQVVPSEGIYKREAGQLIICLGSTGDRPIRFNRDKTHNLLILNPVSPPKK